MACRQGLAKDLHQGQQRPHLPHPWRALQPAMPVFEPDLILLGPKMDAKDAPPHVAARPEVLAGQDQYSWIAI